MSFPSHDNSDDFDILSVHSQSSQTRTRKNQHLSLAQMRGVIQIFNHYFPKNQKKRLSKIEKQNRWKSYKQRIYREYGRVINGQFASEKALIKRYSDPLTFLKYKLKRATNLKISDLSPLDQDYYREIGGLADVNELIRKTYNIDSVQKIAEHVNKRPRLEMEAETNESTLSQNYFESIDDLNYNRNHNHNNHRINNIHRQRRINNFENNSPIIDLSSVPPQVSCTPNITILKKEKKTEYSKNIDAALRNLNNKMDVFEQEVLDKKKIETFEITKQKFASLKYCLDNLLKEEQHLIGFIPGVGTCTDQLENAFYYWLNDSKQIIKNEIDLGVFIQQIMTMKNDKTVWNEFLSKWKLLRIMYDNNFTRIWNQIKNDMNIPSKAVNSNTNQSNNVSAKNNSKREADCTDDDI